MLHWKNKKRSKDQSRRGSSFILSLQDMTLKRTNSGFFYYFFECNPKR